jgi:hypothetical protein
VQRSALLVAWLVACGDTAAVHSTTAAHAAVDAEHSNAGNGAANATGVADAGDDFKGCPGEIPSFEPGLQALGKHFAVKLLAAMPAEPERHLNDWTVELSSLDGSAAPDAIIDHGETFMPIHGHNGGVVPKMTALSEPGQFQVDRLNFIMRGPWEVRLWLSSASLGDDYAVFQICVAK